MGPARLYQYLARDLCIRYHRRLGPKCGPLSRARAAATPPPSPSLPTVEVADSVAIPSESKRTLSSLLAALVHTAGPGE